MGCYREIFSAAELLPSVSRVIALSQSYANSVLVAKKVTISEMASVRSILSCRVGPFLSRHRRALSPNLLARIMRFSRVIPENDRGSVRTGELKMLQLGWKAGTEQYPPNELLEYAVAAEEAGFDSIDASDHFHPWAERGQACFVWTWLGAAAVTTSKIKLPQG